MTDAQGWKGRPPENPSPLGPLLIELRDIRRRLADLETAAPLQSATISEGGLTIKDGGSIIVRDGGGIRAEYDDGSPSVHFGPLYLADGVPDGVGLHVQAPASGADDEHLQGPDVFRARVFPDGSTAVIIGQDDEPIGYLWGLVGNAWVRAQDYVTLTCVNTLWIETETGYATIKAGQGMSLDSGGQVLINSATSRVFIQHETTSSAANAYLATNGLLQRSTSSRRYKRDIDDLEVNVDDVLKLRPRTWRDRAEVEEDPDVERRYVGFIAEELDEAGLMQWVLYDDQGRPDAIAYDRLVAAVVPVIQDQQQRLDDQAQQIADLRAQLDELRDLVTTTQEA